MLSGTTAGPGWNASNAVFSKGRDARQDRIKRLKLTER